MQLKFVIAVAAVIALGAVVMSHAAASALPPLRTVERVELTLYVGRWYEIARMPNRFQNGCSGSSAEYSLRDDGEVDVINTCSNEKDGSLRQARGRAWTVDPVGNAKLKVSFFWPFRGDYWIIDLDKDYQYAVVGTPDRKYLWILCRTETMDDSLYAAIMQRAKQQGFDVKSVVRESAAIDKKR